MKKSYCEVCGNICENKNNEDQIVKYCCPDCRLNRHHPHKAEKRIELDKNQTTP